jgi:sterol desaturase/sphingolipid hydroxylase (fatty acid hydroxylase superfamily)
VIALLTGAATSLAWAAAVFVPLELGWAEHRAWRRPRWRTDLAFFVGQALLFVPLVALVLTWLFTPLAHVGVLAPLRDGFASLPAAAKLVVALALGDLCAYWGHRAQHAWEPLWRIHAVHHTSHDVDWLAAFREHPLDGLYTQAMVNLPAVALGMDFHVWLGVLTFRGLWAILLHSKARVPLGPFKWVLGAPEFHRAHHAPDPYVGHYANLAPYWDVIFGTHGPTEEPAVTGIDEPHPESWIGLCAWPFRFTATRTPLLDGDGVRGTPAGGLAHPFVQGGIGVLVEDVEEAVGADLEHLGGDAHADGLALTRVEVDDDLHGASAS